jgi:hypothetical protein
MGPRIDVGVHGWRPVSVAAAAEILVKHGVDVQAERGKPRRD